MSAGPIALSRELNLDGHQLFLLIDNLVRRHGWEPVWMPDTAELSPAAVAAIRQHVSRPTTERDLPQRIPQDWFGSPPS